MELCDGGSLLDILNAQAPRPIAERTVLAIFLEVCKAVAHMHSQKPPIAHRDIKIENVLRKQQSWKLCDFGSASTSAGIALDERTRQRMTDDIERNTTVTYRAPEMCDLFRKQIVCEKVDIWALGCMLFKMAFYTDAFEEGTLQILNNRWSIPKNSSFSPQFHDLIKFMLEPDPVRRPHIGQVCERTAQLLNKPNPVAVCYALLLFLILFSAVSSFSFLLFFFFCMICDNRTSFHMNIRTLELHLQGPLHLVVSPKLLLLEERLLLQPKQAAICSRCWIGQMIATRLHLHLRLLQQSHLLLLLLHSRLPVNRQLHLHPQLLLKKTSLHS